jgi:hypothetical protein
LSRRELSKGPSSLADMTASVLQGKFVMGRHVEAPVVRLGGERERETVLVVPYGERRVEW